jgi:hypothetical protein
VAVEIHAIPGARFADPVVLARIGNLDPLPLAIAHHLIRACLQSS